MPISISNPITHTFENDKMPTNKENHQAISIQTKKQNSNPTMRGPGCGQGANKSQGLCGTYGRGTG
jgi:hypothetical protein